MQYNLNSFFINYFFKKINIRGYDMNNKVTQNNLMAKKITNLKIVHTLDKIWLFSMKLFSKSCHQKYDRSFFIKGYQLPICSRCLGLLLGYVIGFFNKFLFNPVLSIIFIFTMFLDGILQLCNIITSNNLRRIVTGFLCGISFINLLKYIIKKFKD